MGRYGWRILVKLCGNASHERSSQRSQESERGTHVFKRWHWRLQQQQKAVVSMLLVWKRVPDAAATCLRTCGGDCRAWESTQRIVWSERGWHSDIMKLWSIIGSRLLYEIIFYSKESAVSRDRWWIGVKRGKKINLSNCCLPRRRHLQYRKLSLEAEKDGEERIINVCTILLIHVVARSDMWAELGWMGWNTKDEQYAKWKWAAGAKGGGDGSGTGGSEMRLCWQYGDA